MYRVGRTHAQAARTDIDEIIEGEFIEEIPTVSDLLDLLTKIQTRIVAPPKREPSARVLIREAEPLRPLYLRPIGGNMSERKAKIVYRDNPATVALALLVGFAAGGLTIGLVTLVFGGF